MKDAKAWVLLKNADLKGIKSVTVAGSNSTGPGTFEVRVGAADGKVIGHSTAAATSSEPLTAPLEEMAGRQDVYLVFDTVGARISGITVNNK